ncbi:MAG: hypothetical protein KGS60_17930 [Verrucomicrobia bacterium]|nr:hypothetical protein [Verrucomicrobiota bacterium]
MKLKTAILGGVLALFGASQASAQSTVTVGGTTYKVYDVTGATAFRSAMNLSLKAMLGGASAKVAFVGSSSYNAADFALYVGSLSSTPTIVRTSQSGSAEGVRDVATATAINYISITQEVLDAASASPSGARGNGWLADPSSATIPANAAATATYGPVQNQPIRTTVVPKYTFSDCAQSITPNPTPTLPGNNVGVISFAFLTNKGHGLSITNMTDQTFESLYSLGKVQGSAFTGNAADTKLVYAMGRNSLSGTRIITLAETKYGPFSPVVQFGTNSDATTAATSGSAPNISVTTLKSVGDGGFTSGSALRTYMNATSASVTIDDVASQDVALVAYMSIADADAVSTFINAGSNKDAVALNYNGVPYSYDNVRNGRYSFWSYERLFGPADEGADGAAFRAALTTAVDGQLSTSSTNNVGIKLGQMNVTRPGGDGAVVVVP